MKLSQIVKILNLEYKGDDFKIKSFSMLEDASEENIVFFDNPKLTQKLKETKAKVILTTKKFINITPKSSIALTCEDPHLCFAILSKYFARKSFDFSTKPDISKYAKIGTNVQIGSNSTVEEGVTIYPNVTIGQNVKIRKNSIIYPGVVIYGDTQIGSNCILQAGAVIGSDGFGYAHTKAGEHIKIYHNGDTILEDNVEIGANSTIDRAPIGSTIIKKGTKIDNLVQIGHNCELGEHCIIVSQAGLSGSTKLGRNVIMGGQSATAGHLSIGDFAVVAARGGVTKKLEGGKTYGGFPLMLQKEWLKKQAKITKITKKI
ncbi:MAG: UDP-3-O-(3-hydroxymyristoyl)glucosamine N-acyltransferase [Sulfurospirillum sp.]